MGSRDENCGIYDLQLKFHPNSKPFCQLTPIIAHVISMVSKHERKNIFPKSAYFSHKISTIIAFHINFYIFSFALKKKLKKKPISKVKALNCVHSTLIQIEGAEENGLTIDNFHPKYYDGTNGTLLSELWSMQVVSALIKVLWHAVCLVLIEHINVMFVK